MYSYLRFARERLFEYDYVSRIKWDKHKNISNETARLDAVLAEHPLAVKIWGVIQQQVKRWEEIEKLAQDQKHLEEKYKYSDSKKKKKRIALAFEKIDQTINDLSNRDAQLFGQERDKIHMWYVEEYLHT